LRRLLDSLLTRPTGAALPALPASGPGR
jgi:hypothetical protein